MGTGAVEERVELDYYPTPEWVTRLILPHLPVAGARVAEPSAGEGHLVRVLLALPPEARPARVAAVELDERRARVVGQIAPTTCGDFLALNPAIWCEHLGGPPTLVVSNPPFSHAKAFVRRALEVVAPGGTVAMLLRLSFLETATRAALLSEHPPDVYALTRRPSFRRGSGRTTTDRWAYGWFVWGPGRGNRWWLLQAPAEGQRRLLFADEPQRQTPPDHAAGDEEGRVDDGESAR